ncbi:hypothetical protein [Halobacillus seohaensis]|uniref:Condensation domain-containing protein n=1 Tax=Halobacillus seohaensis TaxID=447421 RepID=A0ABW2EMM1_9BACI
MDKENDLIVGFEKYTVDSERSQLTVTLNVHSSEFDLKKYQVVYDAIKSSLKEKELFPKEMI